MKKQLQISIPNPCSADWEKMTLAERGRFCASCQTKVHDFAALPDRQIAEILRQEEHVCARMSPDQLEKGIRIPEKSSHWLAGLAAASIVALGTTEAVAQEPVRTDQVSQIGIKGKVRIIPPSQSVTISGTVYDKVRLEPLQYVTITDTISGTTVETDAAGRFTITANADNVLEFFGVGYLPQVITATKDTGELAILLKEDGMILGQVVYHRTFFGRIFHSIGNLFRKNE